MKGWRNPVTRSLYNGEWRTLETGDRYDIEIPENEPLRLRLQETACMADVCGADVMLDRAMGDRLSIPEPSAPEVVFWTDTNGISHSGEPDGHYRLPQVRRPSRELREPEYIDERRRIWARAKAALTRALKTGALVRPLACEQCQVVGFIEAAHHDYDKPLEVRWLCRTCHRAWDRVTPKSKPA